VINAVDPAERVHCSVDERCDGHLVTDVASHAERVPTGVHDVVRDGGCGLFGHVADRNGCTFLGEKQRGSPADVGSSAAQEHDLSVQLTHPQPLSAGIRLCAGARSSAWAVRSMASS
jgi:hypothetical protein